jgi:glutamate synthase (NADPH/NADH) small chain
VPDSEKIVPAQLVLFAMGFSGPENLLLDQLGVEKDLNDTAESWQWFLRATASRGVP